MGTNYYYKDKNEKHWHIGKSSIGWEFSWQAQPMLDIYSSIQWISFLEKQGNCIIDEYKTEISLEEFKEIIDNEKRGENLLNQVDWIIKNQPCFSFDYYKDYTGASFTLQEFS